MRFELSPVSGKASRTSGIANGSAMSLFSGFLGFNLESVSVALFRRRRAWRRYLRDIDVLSYRENHKNIV